MEVTKKQKQLLDEFEKAMRAALAEPAIDEPNVRYFPMTYDVSRRTFYKEEEKTEAELVN